MGIGSEQANSYQILSRIATNDGHGENSAYFDGWKAYDSDPFHPTLNPGGVIQMGLAENQVTSCFPIASSVDSPVILFLSIYMYIYLCG